MPRYQAFCDYLKSKGLQSNRCRNTDAETRTAVLRFLGYNTEHVDSRDVLEKLDKDWCYCKDSFIEKRLFQSRDEYFQISTPVIDLFTDDYQNGTDFGLV